MSVSKKRGIFFAKFSKYKKVISATNESIIMARMNIELFGHPQWHRYCFRRQTKIASLQDVERVWSLVWTCT